MMGKTAEKWICCGYDIVELCRRAGCSLPERCFFCGNAMTRVDLVPQPEDEVAFELAELWCGKIREYYGDPESHAPSFDQYGRTDIEAWRAVGRWVLGRTDMQLLCRLKDSLRQLACLKKVDSLKTDSR